MSDQTLWLTLLSELFVNLAAGWFGAAIVLPASIKSFRKLNLWVLTTNVIFAIVSLWVAFQLRKQTLLF
ncbi:hypothetical protein A2875_02375 [Candidatus Gottesmanbacteria bacterium RIFCSPHIGHO2_01_FULL_46_14]|uniref:Uncharacterized protein n=2 Tax=Candidatus Gottesmaniibacteriota TaxID=1752720 RepID=A0A1F5ZTH9_9BACT|nr:MAG: hypothetical protein A2875_02375 [Candidatus Gottesmanbacteria bacterium RIFCSPHIGHO2_01_FULL_46_14]OGG29190.1 MAG: hypothetical protein A2971_00335 [Candidatus Gottesmanbacteria bacterium RIFCSPLOWO2_01_FULL_46_21]